MAERFVKFLAPGLLFAGACWLRPHGQLHQLGEVAPFLAGLAIMAAGYLLALRVRSFPAVIFWTTAIALRFLMLTVEPGDDLFRYIWEGRVLGSGRNPYLLGPDDPALSALRDTLWAKVAHRESTAIYPPLAELFFTALGSAGAGVLAFKLTFMLADLAICVLLVRRFGQANALTYAWNPLVLYVFAGGGHYDSLFLLPLVAAWLVWRKDAARPGIAATLLGVAIAVKWLALPMLGWLAWRERERSGWRAAAIVLGLGALPMLGSWALICAMTGEWTIHLAPAAFVHYARSAELIPALIAAVVPVTQFLNGIYLVPIALAWAWTILRVRPFEEAAEWMFFALFVLSPLVHGWYFTWLLPFAVATRNPGSIALTITGQAYFWVYHRFHLPGNEWTFTWPERIFIWLPFVALFLWSKRQPRAAIAP